MTEKELIELIKKDRREKEDKYIANSYYKYKPKKHSGDFEVNIADSEGRVKTLKFKENITLYINYFKMLVDQKIEYLLSKPPTIKSKLPFTLVDLVDMLKSMMLNASLDSVSWLHFYVENNKLDWIIIRDIEIIPIYDSKKKNIIQIIRYYDNDTNDKDTYKVEIWSLTGVKILTISKDKILSEMEQTHITTETKFNNEIIDTEYYNFPFLPFIPLYNNKGKDSDLEGIKELLDFYNEISSGFISNIYKFQEALTKLKGFSGDEEVLKETERLMRKYRMVGLPEDGDIEPVTIEIPVEARKFMLDLLKDAIFYIGRGYDHNLLGEGNITNIVIKSRYFPLDNKANETEEEEKKFYQHFINCVNMYYNSNYNDEIDNNRNQLFNESEKLHDCTYAIDLVNNGLLSRRTLVSMIPYVDDVDKELKLIEAEREEREKRQQAMFDQQGQNLSNDNSGQNLPNDNSGQNLTNEGRK